MTTSSSALADAMEGEEPTPGVEGGGQHKEVFLGNSPVDGDSPIDGRTYPCQSS